MQTKAYAKVNIFLKITGFDNGYHTLLSRFMKVDDLYDTITFTPSKNKEFIIEGCNNIPTKQNTIYKGYMALLEYTKSHTLKEFFNNHKTVVDKNIPSQAGLGGGSSDVAAFMNMANKVCNLGIDTDELARLGSTIGADVPFFIYGYSSANIKGFGEIVEPFDEKPIRLKIITPSDISCDTAKVYKNFHKHLLQEIDPTTYFGWENIDSKTLLSLINNPIVLNDLYPAALMTCPKLKELQMDGWFFSGSGSSFFKEESGT